MTSEEAAAFIAQTRAYQETCYAWLEGKPKLSKQESTEFERLELVLGYDLKKA